MKSLATNQAHSTYIKEGDIKFIQMDYVGIAKTDIEFFIRS